MTKNNITRNISASDRNTTPNVYYSQSILLTMSTAQLEHCLQSALRRRTSTHNVYSLQSVLLKLITAHRERESFIDTWSQD